MFPLLTVTEDEMIRQTEGRPCACGAAPLGTPQKVVSEIKQTRRPASFADAELDAIVIESRCDMECQRCHRRHSFATKSFVSNELLSSLTAK